MSVFKSGKHVYAQVIDDIAGKTLASASTVHKAHKGEVKDLKPLDAAKKVGEKIAIACKEKKIDKVVFDRNGSYLSRASEGSRRCPRAGATA